MAITGTTFDRMRVKPADDAAVYAAAAQQDGVIHNPVNEQRMSLSTSGLSVTVSAGRAMVAGRLVEITEPITLEAAPNTTKGYVAIVIDLTNENTSTGTPGQDDYTPVNNQVSLQLVDSIVKQDIWNDGKIYMFSLATYKTDTTTITTGNDEEIDWDPAPFLGPSFKSDGCNLHRVGNFFMLSGYVSAAVDIPASTKVVLLDFGKMSDVSWRKSGFDPHMPHGFGKYFVIGNNSFILGGSIEFSDRTMVLRWAEKQGTRIKITKGTQLNLNGLIWASQDLNFKGGPGNAL